jgi:uncharacterized protein (TIGR02246 family)
MRRFTLAVIAAAILLPALCHASPIAAADASAIRAVIDRQRDAWNRHDMDAFVADTTPDVDWVNIVGIHWEGRETVRRAHAVLHKGIFALSRLLPPELLELREIAPGVVVAVFISRVEGAGALPGGAPYPDGGQYPDRSICKDRHRLAHRPRSQYTDCSRGRRPRSRQSAIDQTGGLHTSHSHNTSA